MMPEPDSIQADLEAAYDAAFGTEDQVPDDLADQAAAELDGEAGDAEPDPEAGAEQPDRSLGEELEAAYDRAFAEPVKEPDWLEQAFAPYSVAMEAHGVSTQQAVESALAAHEFITRDPARGIAHLAMQYAVDDPSFAGQLMGRMMAASGQLGEGARLDYMLEIERERARPKVERMLRDAGAEALRPAIGRLAMSALERGEVPSFEKLLAQARQEAGVAPPKPAAVAKSKTKPPVVRSLEAELRDNYRAMKGR
jgi:hypothetical protein